jgi:hydroxyacylglutathione hydrolase
MVQRFVVQIGNYQVTQVVTGTWKENCYVIADTEAGELAVIDPGDDAGEILAVVSDSNLAVVQVLLTHGHYDHIGAANELCELFDVPCRIHERDLKLLKRAPLYAINFEKKQVNAPACVATFADGEEFRVGALTLCAFPAPGHTPGGVCFLGEGMVFSGDTLMRESIGRTDLPGGDFRRIHMTVAELMHKVPGDPVVFPGHGVPWTMEEARAWHKKLKQEPRR